MNLKYILKTSRFILKKKFNSILIPSVHLQSETVLYIMHRIEQNSKFTQPSSLNLSNALLNTAHVKIIPYMSNELIRLSTVKCYIYICVFNIRI